MEEGSKQPVIEVKATPTKTFTVRVNPWWLSALLGLGLIAMFVLWRPWVGGAKAGDRTISVSGVATLKAEPDEFLFNPQYEFKNADKAAGLAELTAQSDAVVAGLQKIGVADKDIKTNASGYQDYYFYDSSARTHNYALNIMATTHSSDMAQKVQDYLLTTTPTGVVTPQATFSTAKQKQLELRGRDAAAKEARAKAEQQAKNLGFKIDRIKSIEDNNNLDDGCGMYGLCSGVTAMDATDAKQPSLILHSGQNELTHSVRVVYYIK